MNNKQKKKVYISQEELVKRVGVIHKKLQDPNYISLIYPEVLKSKRSSKTNNQEYKLIAEILEGDYGGTVASNITIWRILKIQQESPELYEEVAKGNISIRSAFNELNNVQEKLIKIDADGNKEIKEFNFDNLYGELQQINKSLEDYKNNTKESLNVQRLKQIDGELFKARKQIGKIIIDIDSDDFI